MNITSIMHINRLKIGTRLSLEFGILLFFIISIACISQSALVNMKTSLDVITGENNVETMLANRIANSLNVVERSVRNYMVFAAPERKQEEKFRINDARIAMDKAYAQLEALVTHENSAQATQLLSTMKARRDEVRPMFNRIMALSDAGNTSEANTFLEQSLRQPQEQWFAAVQGMVDLQEKENQKTVDAMNRDYVFTVNVLIAAAVSALTIGIMMAWVITRGLLKQLGGEPNDAAAITAEIAAGNLAISIDTKTGDQSSLLFAMKSMRNSLSKIVGEVRTGADTIAAESNQITNGTLDLSSRTEQQASSLEETASSMEELTSTVKQNADNARQANALAVCASEVAIKGGKVVSQVVDTMGSINASSKKIVDIISVIDSIAFQTNILALNAAVEAARAGEQGRGFAVVATEVRNLAQRSANAAKEIGQLIGDSVEKVDVGTRLVDQAGAAMQEIVASVKRVTDIMNDITIATTEQTTGIEQINQAIMQMDQVTQQNCALVEETAAAAQSLQHQADNLAKLVNIFTLHGQPLPALPEKTANKKAGKAPAMTQAPVAKVMLLRH